MKTYRHKKDKKLVQAVQLVRPYRTFTNAFPRSHPVTLPSGKISHYHLVDAGKAYPGDFVLKHEDGTVERMTEEEFNQDYKEME